MNHQLLKAGPIVCLFAFAFFQVDPSRATVLDVKGRVATTVQEILDGEPGSVTSDESEVGVDATELPVSAGASLETTDFEDRVVALGQGLCELAVPDLTGTNGPQELGLEVAGYSDAESVSYLVTGSAVEDRRLLFAGPGNELATPEFPFNAVGTREIESRISLSGAIVVWSLQPSADLRSVEGALEVAVRHDEELEPLFLTSVSLSGATELGTALEVVGPIRTQRMTVDDLVALGLDDESAAILRDVEETGTLAIFLITQQEHRYRFTVRRDVSFSLKAELAARVRNAPGATGVAATLGRPFSELADFIGRAMPGVNGARVEELINKAIAAGNGTSPTVDRPIGTTSRSICGAFGAEGLFAALLGLAFAPRSRRRPRSG